jgi:hypothetical protein
VSASRVSEKFLESPVTIERISSANIKTAPASGYYDILGTLKGVDVVAASILFRSISTRGFNGSGNTRLNQLIDGMDNQLPGLNFSVSSVVGLTELDVDNIEVLPGASSALYGSGGMNGTVLINSKNPFKYQGLSFQIKQGVNHIDEKQRPQAPFLDYTVRWASKIGDRFAYKVSAQYTEAQDWLPTNTSNYSRLTGNGNGGAIAGTRLTDPNYDGINIYGEWFQIKIPYNLVITQFSLKPRISDQYNSYYNNRMVNTFYLVGSNDGVEWSNIYYLENQEFYSESQNIYSIGYAAHVHDADLFICSFLAQLHMFKHSSCLSIFRSIIFKTQPLG